MDNRGRHCASAHTEENFLIFRPLRASIALGLIVPAIAACGGGDDAETTTPTSPSANGAATAPGGSTGTAMVATPDAGSPSPAVASSQPSQPSTAGSAGSVTIDGQVTAIREVHRCEPYFDSEDGLDLIGIGDGVEAFVTLNPPPAGSGFTMFEISIQGKNAGGVFSGMANSLDGTTWTDEFDEPLPGRPFERTDDRISGTLELVEAQVGEEVRDVTVDFEIPAEISEC